MKLTIQLSNIRCAMLMVVAAHLSGCCFSDYNRGENKDKVYESVLVFKSVAPAYRIALVYVPGYERSPSAPLQPHEIILPFGKSVVPVCCISSDGRRDTAYISQAFFMYYEREGRCDSDKGIRYSTIGHALSHSSFDSAWLKADTSYKRTGSERISDTLFFRP